MRNRLQYLYSITVFLGAFVTAYLMMDRNLNARVPYRPVQTPAMVSEANIDPALGSLFEIEKGLGKLNQLEKDQKRIPSQMDSKKR